MIAATEIADLFRDAIANKVSVTLGDPAHTWVQTYCGNVGFKFGDWTIVFFNDCDEMDYVDQATAPDGRTVEYDHWVGPDPVDLLTVEEFNALSFLLEKAQ